MTLDGQSEERTDYNRFIIEPAYPFIFLPINLYRAFENWLKNQNKFADAEYTTKSVIFRQSCDEVKDQGLELDFEMKIDDNTIFTLNLADILIPSSVIDN